MKVTYCASIEGSLLYNEWKDLNEKESYSHP